MTNGDKIRVMTDEQLVKIFTALCDYAQGCEICMVRQYCNGRIRTVAEWAEWLKAPANEHGGDEK